MHLALTNDLHVNGGAVSLMAHRYVKALNDAGHHATLITGCGDDPLPKDVPVVSWKYPIREPGILGSIKLGFAIRSLSGSAFANWRQSVSDDGNIPSGWLAMVVPSADGAMRNGGADLPLLYICNSPWAMEWKAAFEAQHHRSASLVRQALPLYLRRKMERRVVSHAIGWTALSQLQLDWFQGEHPSASARIREVISGAVDCRDFLPMNSEERRLLLASEGHDPALPTLICSRRLVPRTGVDLLVKAHACMRNTSTLVITGDGPERENLAKQAANSPRAPLVKMLGFVSREQLVSLTASSTISVLPTRALEGFGLSAAEAFACGTPVVSTPVAALQTVVGGLDQRLLASDVSAESLANALDSLLESQELSSEAFRSKCRKYAEDRFDWNRMQYEFVSLVERVMEPIRRSSQRES